MGDARDTEKAPDAFRTISEVAEDLELPQHVLRFWESRFSQIKPVKRAGGRRFYRPDDIDLLRGIRHLLYTDGYTIKGAQRILKDQGVRFVQDLGIEREVAVMNSARPARGGEGVTFGGLLGLIPRRRGRRGEEGAEALPALPETAELPLPFPDAEADRDLAAEAPEAPAPLRQMGRARESAGERREPAFEASPARGRDRREAPLASPPPRHEPPPIERNPPDRHAPPPPDNRAPRSAGPRRERVEPVLAARPTRGPAARIAQDGTHDEGRFRGGHPGEPRARGSFVEQTDEGQAPHAPEFDDPLLPFLEEMPAAPSVSEPIEARIRRLKSQERRPIPPFEDEPPYFSGSADARSGSARYPDHAEERGLPTHATFRAPREHASPEADWPAAERFPDARAGHPGGRRVQNGPASGPLLRDGEWRQTDWVDTAGDPTHYAPEQDLPAAGHGRRQGGRGPYVPDERHASGYGDGASGGGRSFDDGPYHDDPPGQPARMERPLPHAAPSTRMPPAEPESIMTDPSLPRHRGPWPRDPRGAASMEGSAGRVSHGQPPHDTYRQPTSAASDQTHAAQAGYRSEHWEAGWGEAPPRALPRAQRVGPLIGPIQEDDAFAGPLMPEAEQRAMAERMAGRPGSPPAEPSGASAHPTATGLRHPTWTHPAPEPQRPASEEPTQRVPREPLRQGPPEQYLPPHLRSEPRVMGQAPVAAPVLSRDDVHRMQSALYELGECRRLMEGLLGQRGEARTAD